MEGTVIAAVVSSVVVVAINGGIVAYGYGKLTQKVEELGKHLAKIDNTISNGHGIVQGIQEVKENCAREMAEAKSELKTISKELEHDREDIDRLKGWKEQGGKPS